MNKIWNQRLDQYQKKLLKYLRYVFNDHFVIALFFVFGAACYGYFNFIDHYVRPMTLMDRVVAIVALFVILQIGKFATLLQKPDIVFLLPNDYRISEYLIKARHHSMSMTAIIQVACGLLIVPFLVRILHFNWIEWGLVLIAQVLLKWGNLLYDEVGLFDQKWNSKMAQWGKQLIPLAVIVLGIWINPAIACVLALINWACLIMLRKRTAYHVFKWNTAIENEDQRIMRIYKFFSLFADVPEVHQKIKRRRYLDCLMPRYRQNPDQTYSYLYWLGFWRNSEYSGLFMRLTIIGILLLLFINLKWVACLIGALFVYLTGFQLLPLANNYYDIVFTHLYPLSEKQQLSAFRKVFGSLILIQVIIFAGVMLISTHSLEMVLIMIGVSAVIYGFLGWSSLNKRFSKVA